MIRPLIAGLALSLLALPALAEKRDVQGITLGDSGAETQQALEALGVNIRTCQHGPWGAMCEVDAMRGFTVTAATHLDGQPLMSIQFSFCSADKPPVVAAQISEAYGVPIVPATEAHYRNRPQTHKVGPNTAIKVVLGYGSRRCIQYGALPYELDLFDPTMMEQNQAALRQRQVKTAPTPKF